MGSILLGAQHLIFLWPLLFNGSRKDNDCQSVVYNLNQSDYTHHRDFMSYSLMVQKSSVDRVALIKHMW